MAAAKRSIELREFRRLALWGASAAGAVALMVLVLLSGSVRDRLPRTASPSVETAKPVAPAAVGPGPTADAKSAAKEAEQLAETVRVLTAERDRLLERVGSLEQALGDVTGSIARAQMPDPDAPASEPPLSAASPAYVPEPTKFTPSGLALALALPNLALETSQAPQAAPSEPATAEPPSHGEFGIDLGRSATIEGLRSLWATIRSRHGSQLEGLRPIVYVRPGDRPGRIELRLIVGPLGGPAAAAKLCAAMTAAGATCRPTAWDGQRLALQ